MFNGIIKSKEARAALLALVAIVLLGTPCTGRSQALDAGDGPVCGSEGQETAVIVNGRYMGATPVKLRLDPDSSYSVTFRKRGYEDATTTVKPVSEFGWVVLDIFSGVLGYAMEPETGDWTFIEMPPAASISRAP